MEKLILHIGPHKTGTTTIQKVLYENRSVLAHQGFCYPNVGIVEYGHHGVAAAAQLRPRWNLAELADVINQSPGVVILTSENFSRIEPEAIHRLANNIAAPEISIIYYQRNFLDLLPKWWAELVKHGSAENFPEYFCSCLLRPFQHHLLNATGTLNRWSDQFGREKISIYLYDHIDDVAAHFCEQVLGIADLPSISPTNKSFGIATTEILRCLNAAGLRGMDVIKGSGWVGEFASEVSDADCIGRMMLDYRCFPLYLAESSMLREWSDRMVGENISTELFSTREAAVEFVRNDFWISNFDFAKKLNNLIESEKRR